MEDGIFPPHHKIIAIGDIHGDLQGFKNCLIKAKIIDKGDNWIAKDTYVVQVGDQIDGRTRIGQWKSDKEEDLIFFIQDLDERAKRHGGRVLSLIGNHEMMNIQGNFSYASDSGVKMFGGINNRKALFTKGGLMTTLLQRTRFAVIKIGDWLFVHGGVLPRISENYSIPYVNKLFRKFCKKEGITDEKEMKDFKNIFDRNDGILYYRGYSDDKPNKYFAKKALENWNCKHMVIGHTIQPKIRGLFDGMIWCIDTGISRAFGCGKDWESRAQCLEIINNENTNVIS